MVTNAKQALKARIRTIVRSQQKPNPIYAAATRVASARYRPGTQPAAASKDADEDVDFKTSFTVQVRKSVWMVFQKGILLLGIGIIVGLPKTKNL